MINCGANRERYMNNYSALGTITVMILTAIITNDKSYLKEKVVERLEEAKKYLEEAQISDEMLYITSSDKAWAYNRARAAILSTGKLESSQNTFDHIRAILDKYVEDLTVIKNLFEGDCLKAISVDQVKDLICFFETLKQVELERSKSRYKPGPLDAHVKYF